MNGFRVTPDDVSGAASYIQGQAEEIDTKIASLRTYVAGLDQYWQGSAHQAFETLMSDYHVYATMLHNALADISQGLRGNYVNYADGEAANLSNIAKVQLPPARF
jgi:WXG100 family type VII secretion target